MEMQSLVYKQFRRSIVDDQKFIKQLERSRRDSGYRRISILPNLDDSTEQDGNCLKIGTVSYFHLYQEN